MTTLDLAYDEFGEAGAPLVILHGLLGSARNWTGIGRQLGESLRVFALDLRNHGRSPWADDHELRRDGGRRRGVHRAPRACAPATVIGHSLGGKVAMRLALTRPELVARLVVVDVAPVAYAHSFAGYIEAMRRVDLAAVQRRADADRQLQRGDPRRRHPQLPVAEPGARATTASPGGVNLAALAANMAS